MISTVWVVNAKGREEKRSVDDVIGDVTGWTREKIEDGIRAERDRRLTETDFHALKDRIMTLSMTAYRQALRNVPQQSGFPYNVDWPEKPGD